MDFTVIPIHAVALKLWLVWRDGHFTMQRICGLTRTPVLSVGRPPVTRPSNKAIRLQVRANFLDSAASTLNVDKYTMSSSKYTTVQQPHASLNNGLKIPLFGLGTWRGEAGQVENAVEMAIKAGYRYGCLLLS